MRYKTFNNGAQIHTWFPKSVYIMKEFKSADTCTDIITRLGELDINLKREYFQVGTSHSVDILHTHNSFKGLFDDIMEHCKAYASTYGYSDGHLEQLTFGDTWFNISKPGDFLHKHIHPNSLLSGAFYIKTNKDDHITFYKEDDMSTPTTEDTELSIGNYSYPCETGELVIFKSNLNHSTNIQQGEEKIVISFNCYLKIQ
jgi:uncharacterized protein (TIGR02466 family)